MSQEAIPQNNDALILELIKAHLPIVEVNEEEFLDLLKTLYLSMYLRKKE